MAATETVRVIRPAKPDNIGNRPGSAVAQWDVPGWQCAPGPSREAGAGVGQVESDGTLYGPPVTAVNRIVSGGIQPTDKIRVRGDDYQVVGRVQDWGSSGSVVVLKRVTG